MLSKKVGIEVLPERSDRRPGQGAVPLQMAWKHPGIEKHPGTGGPALRG
jgi:hypothetical protein